MVNATEDIIICNYRRDQETRRDTYTPTRISGVTVYYAAGASATGGQGGMALTDNLSYKIRIPITAEIESGREFVRSEEYANLKDGEEKKYWTIQSGSYVILGTVADESALTDEQAIMQCGNDYFAVLDYSDNTRRGSKSVQHWRIGGS